MRNWDNHTVNIGEVREGSRQIITFKSLRPMNISRVQPSCTSCTKFLDYKDNILSIRYDVEDYPRHLIGTNNKPVINNELYVYYEEGYIETLRFVGFITR